MLLAGSVSADVLPPTLPAPELERSMRPMVVVVADVDVEDMFELAAAEDEQAIKALAADAADPALGVGVRVRRPNRRPDDGDAFALEDVVESAAELAVAVVDQVALPRSPLPR